MSLRPPTVIEFSEWLTLLADQIHRINWKECDNIKKKGRVLHVTEELCPVCDSSHTLADCVEFSKLSYVKRWSIVRKQMLCFSCLERGHRLEVR